MCATRYEDLFSPSRTNSMVSNIMEMLSLSSVLMSPADEFFLTNDGYLMKRPLPIRQDMSEVRSIDEQEKQLSSFVGKIIGDPLDKRPRR